MKFKKIDENRHGAVVNVITDKGFCIGQIEKWCGLFVPTDWDGSKHQPCNKRNVAAQQMEERFDFARTEG